MATEIQSYMFVFRLVKRHKSRANISSIFMDENSMYTIQYIYCSVGTDSKELCAVWHLALGLVVQAMILQVML